MTNSVSALTWLSIRIRLSAIWKFFDYQENTYLFTCIYHIFLVSLYLWMSKLRTYRKCLKDWLLRWHQCGRAWMRCIRRMSACAAMWKNCRRRIVPCVNGWRNTRDRRRTQTTAVRRLLKNPLKTRHSRGCAKGSSNAWITYSTSWRIREYHLTSTILSL